MLKQRSEVDSKDKWNVEALYSSDDAWKQDFSSFAQDNPAWKPLGNFRGKLHEPKQLKQALDLLMDCARHLSKLYTYAHLRHDENIADDQFKVAYNQIITSLHAFEQAIAWFEPEILTFSDDVVDSLLSAPELAEYRFYLEKIIRQKPHTLPEAQEELIALSRRPMQTAHRAFSALNDADFSFGTALDSNGKEHPLTHASMGMLMRSHDRTLRKNTFINMHQKYVEHENTMAELLHGQIQSHIFEARARNYPSCLDAALYSKNIDKGVYHSLIKAVSENLAPLHQYYALREKVLGIPLHLYDMQVPLTPDFDIKMTYEEAEQLVVESVAPLGTEYQDILKEGLLTGRWVDRYENKGKRSGAYSSGCYDSMPYILMNYKGILRDVFTLAHEAGHSMHSYYSHKAQPFQYADYSIFLAEVASTFNEELLTRLMLKSCDSLEEKIFLLNHKLDDIRGTFFRQTMFAEFELLIHDAAENGQPLTPQFLNSEYRKLNAKYFGPKVTLDDASNSEWARIPHFYYNFYVYQYATGISAAFTLADKVYDGNATDREAYLNFLRGGCSEYPLDLLRSAGADMLTPEPVEKTVRLFKEMVDELSTLVNQRENEKVST